MFNASKLKQIFLPDKRNNMRMIELCGKLCVPKACL